MRSVISQKTDFEFEVLVRDDCSDDGTADVLSVLKSEFPEISTFIENENRWGLESPFTKLLSAASGEFLAILEGDDFWMSDQKLQLCVEALQGDPRVSLVGHTTVVVDEKSHPIIDENGLRLLIGNPGRTCQGSFRKLHTSSMVMRRAILEQATFEFPFVPNTDLLIKGVAAENGDTLVLDETLSAYRVHSGGSWSQLEDEAAIRNRVKVLTLLYSWSKELRPELAPQLALAHRSLVKNFVDRRLISRAIVASLKAFIRPSSFQLNYWSFLMALPNRRPSLMPKKAKWVRFVPRNHN